MGRICALTGSASGIGAATASLLRRQGFRVIGNVLHDADVVADLTTTDGRAVFVRRVSLLAGGRIEALVANSGGGPLEASLSLSFFGDVGVVRRAAAAFSEQPCAARGRHVFDSVAPKDADRDH